MLSCIYGIITEQHMLLHIEHQQWVITEKITECRSMSKMLVAKGNGCQLTLKWCQNTV